MEGDFAERQVFLQFCVMDASINNFLCKSVWLLSIKFINLQSQL